MSAIVVRPFLGTHGRFSGQQFRHYVGAKSPEVKPLWQTIRWFSFLLSLGGGFPLWNLGSKGVRFNYGQVVLNIWLIIILGTYCWWSVNTATVMHRSGNRISQKSIITHYFTMSVGVFISIRTVFAIASNWWHRATLAKIFSTLEDLQNKLGIEFRFTRRLCGLALFLVLSGIGISGVRVYIFLGEPGFFRNAWNVLALVCALCFVDIVAGRSPVLLFCIFAEACLVIAETVRLRLEELVKSANGKDSDGKRQARKIDELRVLHGLLTNTLPEWNSCFSSALTVDLLVDMLGFIAIAYYSFMDLIPSCQIYPTSMYCPGLALLAYYFVACFSYIAILCIQGERLYRTISGIPNIIHTLPTVEDKSVEKAVTRFATQVHSSDTTVSIHNSFDIRLSLLPAVIGTVVTYFIIIVQFRQSDGTNKT